ncbi:uncharacterized protein LOC135388888 [Ornithodoros turicata]|uniref:uncharacterized protein LOC135388888 n=1 Tax=Ornithodoros turicata TaxID=34597 RepID=UPI00313A309E
MPGQVPDWRPKSRSLPARPLDPRTIFAQFRKEESSWLRPCDGNEQSSLDESSISSDTSCSSVEFHRPESAGLDLLSPADDQKASSPRKSPADSRGSNESLLRRERKAAKARAEAARREKCKDSSSEDEDELEKSSWMRAPWLKAARRRLHNESFPRLPPAGSGYPVWQESAAYQEPAPKVIMSDSGGGRLFQRSIHGISRQTVLTSPSPSLLFMSPSPHDSGVSSQSVASSPSLGRVPTPPPRRCQSRALSRENLASPQNGRHSVSLDSFPSTERAARSLKPLTLSNGHGNAKPRSPITQSSYSDLGNSVQARPRGLLYSYTDQAPRNDLPSPSLSDGGRRERRSFAAPPPRLSPNYRMASASVEALAPQNGRTRPPDRRRRPLSLAAERTWDCTSGQPPLAPKSLETATKRLDDVMKRERERRYSANLETALSELEEIYESLKLNEDEDLLFRAERRDLPTQFQLNRPERTSASPEAFPLTRSSSDSIASWTGSTQCFQRPRQRAPSFRRSAIPDKLKDDLAYRRLVQPKEQLSRGNISPKQDVSYLLCSAAFTPTIEVHPLLTDLTLANEPDIEKDDLWYRNYTQADAGRVSAPHPPPGIPLSPTNQCSATDYLRAKPSGTPRPLTRPKGTPDIVGDDLAYRSLRKDSTRRQFRNARCLSANASTPHQDAQSMTDVLDALKRESQRWKQLDEDPAPVGFRERVFSEKSKRAGRADALRRAGRGQPLEDGQLEQLLAALICDTECSQGELGPPHGIQARA